MPGLYWCGGSTIPLASALSFIATLPRRRSIGAVKPLISRGRKSEGSAVLPLARTAAAGSAAILARFCFLPLPMRSVGATFGLVRADTLGNLCLNCGGRDFNVRRAESA